MKASENWLRDYAVLVTDPITVRDRREIAAIGNPRSAHDRVAPPSSGHRIRDGHRVVAKQVLGGLHHEYRLERMAA